MLPCRQSHSPKEEIRPQNLLLLAVHKTPPTGIKGICQDQNTGAIEGSFDFHVSAPVMKNLRPRIEMAAHGKGHGSFKYDFFPGVKSPARKAGQTLHGVCLRGRP